MDELKPLFVHITLTPEHLYNLLNPAGKWSKALGNTQRRYTAAVETLCMQLCLCKQCGARTQLNQDGVCDEGCEKEPALFDWSSVIKRYAELYKILPEEYCEAGVKMQDELDALEEMANGHGLEFAILENKVALIAMEER